PSPATLPELEGDDVDDTTALGSLSRLFNGGVQTGLSLWLTKKFGGCGVAEDGDGGSELPMGGSRVVGQAGEKARLSLVPVTLAPTEVDTVRGRGWSYPEWDVHAGRYRDRWCTVTELEPPAGTANAARPRMAD